MPALNLIIGANATPFAQAMKAVEAAAKRTGSMAVGELAKHAKQIEAAMKAAGGAGQQNQFYAAALRAVNVEIARQTSLLQAANAATDSLAASQARIALGMGTNSDRRRVARAARLERNVVAGGVDREVRSGVRQSQEEWQAEMAMLDAQENAARRQREIEQAGRDNRARRLRRERAERRANAPMQGPDLDGDLRTQASIEAASRDNRARALRRQREQARLDGEVSQAARENRARALRRERAEARAARQAAAAEEARAESVEQASRDNRARALRRQRERTSLDAEIEQAARDNRARALRRQRAADRAERARTTGIRGAWNNLTDGVFNRFLGIWAVIGMGYSAVRFVGEIFRMDIAMTRVRTTLKAISGDSRQAAKDFDYLVSESSRIGFSLQATADSFARFAIAAKQAGLTIGETRSTFSNVMEAAATMGLSPERTGEALLALEQMLSKGTVAAQELRLQLGNAMPAAVNEMAKALGITVRQLFTALETGSINAADAVQRFGEQVKKDFNLTPEANRLQRDLVRLQNQWDLFKASLGEASRPAATNFLEGWTEVFQRFALGLKLNQQGFGFQSIFELFTPGIDATMALDARLAAFNKMKEELDKQKKPRAGALDNEAKQIIATADERRGKESELNKILNERLRILELLNSKDKLSKDTYEQLTQALGRLKFEIEAAGATDPLDKLRIQLRALQADMRVAQRDLATARTPQAREILGKNVTRIAQSIGAKRTEIGIAESAAAAETWKQYEDMRSKNDLAALDNEKQITELKRRQASLANFIQTNRGRMTPENYARAMLDLETIHGDVISAENRVKEKKEKKEKPERLKGFSLGDTSQHRAGSYTGPALTLIDVNRQQLRELQEIKNKLPGVGSAAKFQEYW